MARETVRIEGLDTLLDRLRRLGPEASKRGGPVRVAVRKAALVIVNQAKANVRAFVSEPNAGGWPDESTGLMEKSIRPIRGRPNRGGLKGETYLVTIPRRVRYPITKRTPSGINVSQVGRMHEYGVNTTITKGPMKGRTLKLKPQRWMGRAFHAKKGEAVQVMTDDVLKGIEALEKKLGMGG